MNDRHTVLLVDDDKDVLLGASKRLGAAGLEVLLAYDGYECLARAGEHRPDAIVLDVRMPRKDGLETLAELRCGASTKDIPVVMLSASLGDERAALEAGARFFLRKPYAGPMLIDAVRKAIADGVQHVDASDSTKNQTSPLPSNSSQLVQPRKSTTTARRATD